MRAIGWNAIGGGVAMAMSFVISIVLSRLLGPEPFGILAVGLSLVGMVEGFAVMGFHSSLIRQPSISRVDFHAIRWVVVGSATLIAAALWVAAPLLAALYRIEAYGDVLRVLGMLPLFQAIAMTDRAYLERSLAYDALIKVRVAAIVVGGVVGIALALEGYDVWSLVVYTVLTAALTTIGIYRYAGLGWSCAFDAAVVRRHLRFSLEVFVSNLWTGWVRKVDVLVLGPTHAAATVGLYYRGKSLSELATSLPSNYVFAPIFPALSSIQGDVEKFRRRLGEILTAVSGLFTPFYLAVLLYAEELLVLLYGDSWRGASPYLSLWMGIAWLHILRKPCNFALLACGKSSEILRLEGWLNAVRLVWIVATAWWSIIGMLWGLLVIKLVDYGAYAATTARAVGMSWQAVGYRHLSDVLLAAIVLLTVRWIGQWTLGGSVPWIWLISGALGIALYGWIQLFVVQNAAIKHFIRYVHSA